jgi:radical SAM protein with 4Fe4S-binding SPASM domain
MNKSNFCPAPWMHLHIINDGRAFPCCQTPLENKHSFGNVKNNTLLEILNSDNAKQMRLNMLKGDPLPSSCERCTSKEVVGMNSMRTGLVSGYGKDTQSFINKTNADGSLDELELQYWDFRFSNYCNLSCRTCGPIFSTSWAKDAKIIWSSENKQQTLIDLKDADLFWNDITNHIDSVQEIHFAGGEPVIMEEHWQMIDLLLEKRLFNTRLRYSTNATVLTYKGRNILDVWKQFTNVHVSLSIDGVNDAFEYIRNRGVWNTTKENLLAIADSEVKYWVHPTLSVLNIYRLVELHEILLNLNILNPSKDKRNLDSYFITQFHINPLFTPEYYSLQSLPAKHKKEIEKMLLSYSEKMFLKYGIPKSGWISIIEFMNAADTSHEWGNFIEMTNKLDAVRKQSFIRINPEFSEYFNV